MKKLSKNRLLEIVIKLLFFALLAKFIALIALWFLPAEGVEQSSANFQKMPYVRANFHNLIEPKKREKKSHNESKSEALNIRNMILIALYGDENSGYVIVAKKTLPTKTTIVAVGESYAGYKLSKIFLNYVIFTKNSKEYILHLQNPTKSIAKRVNIAAEQESEIKEDVSREDLKYYAKNPTEIWRDISINELKRSGKIIGFKVTKIRKNSKFSKLGLQRGDIIIEANAIALNSYKAVMQIYQNIDKIDTLSLKVKRGNTEKEIIYDIH
jgi:general secretion pathway protein C